MIYNYYAYKGYWIRRNNTGSHQLHNNEGRSRFVRYGIKGSGDLLIAIPIYGLPVIGYIECKRSNTKQTDAQKDFELDCQRNHIFYCVARSVEDVEEALEVYIKKMEEKLLSKVGAVHPSIPL